MFSGLKPKWPYPVEKLLICQQNRVLKTGADFSVFGTGEGDTKASRQKLSALYYPPQIQSNNNHINNPGRASRRLQVEIFVAKYLLLSDNQGLNTDSWKPTIWFLCYMDVYLWTSPAPHQLKFSRGAPNHVQAQDFHCWTIGAG